MTYTRRTHSYIFLLLTALLVIRCASTNPSKRPMPTATPSPTPTCRPAPTPLRQKGAAPKALPTALPTPAATLRKDVQLTRYPTMETRESVPVGQEFSVLISLTEEQIAPETQVRQGSTTDSGELALSLAAQPEQEEWEIDVVLSAEGFRIQGTDTATIRLPRQGDSTPAWFRLIPQPISGQRQKRTIYATLWHEGKFLAKILRDILVLQPGEMHSMRNRTFRSDPAAASKIHTTGSQVAAPPVTLSRGSTAPPPDLTVYLYYAPGPLSQTESFIHIASPYILPASPTPFRLDQEALSRYLTRHYRTISRAGRGLVRRDDMPRKERTILLLQGFGKELFRKFAPRPFQEAFWKLHDILGEEFDSIQIFSSNPLLPWELMRPTQSDGTDEQDFLGLEFRLARWHVTPHASQFDRPPEILPFHALFVIAPDYTGPQALSNVRDEVKALKSMTGFQPVPGRFDGVSSLLRRDMRSGIIHFAGHGIVQRGLDGLTKYAIRLEDGDIDLMTWRGMFSGAGHPFVFFNACDVGQAEALMNFVEGWAPAVLENGGSGYIGGLWPLSDRGAADFAIRFYRALLQDLQHGSVMIADILRQTRQHFYDTGDPTFLGYIYYGYPDFRLIKSN